MLVAAAAVLPPSPKPQYDRTGSGTGGGEAAPALSAALDGLALAEAARIVLRRPVTAVAAAVVAAARPKSMATVYRTAVASQRHGRGEHRHVTFIFVSMKRPREAVWALAH